MRKSTLAVLLLLAAPAARADFTASGNIQITGQMGVGTTLPTARMEVRMSASDNYALKVSSEDGTGLFCLDKTGKAGLQTLTPRARLDVPGSGDSSDIGLQLLVGNSSTTRLSTQIAFSAPGSTSPLYAHAIGTRHTSGQNLGNSIDFFLWRDTTQPNALGSFPVLSLQAVGPSVSLVSTTSVHILPAGTPDVEVEVSNGITTGGGTIEYAASGVHSSLRALKTDIAYFTPAQAAQALADIRALKHARFRYKRKLEDGRLIRDASQPLARGLIYEEAPASIQGPGKTLVLDDRVLNLELALQELHRRNDALEAKIAAIEKSRKGK